MMTTTKTGLLFLSLLVLSEAGLASSLRAVVTFEDFGKSPSVSVSRSDVARLDAQARTGKDGTRELDLIYEITETHHYVMIEKKFDAAVDGSKSGGTRLALDIREAVTGEIQEGGPGLLKVTLFLTDGSWWSFVDHYVLQRPGPHTLDMPWEGLAADAYSPVPGTVFDPSAIAGWRVQVSRNRNAPAAGRLVLTGWQFR
ncbi:hypothetical protein OpiT1DRAFT_01890 [Opitutaceae bacterium TAV1]|nr:hypothetical protein OpiT1DRAFT_01890 [Opitutaceae bacterium TAV1]